jgi:uncharacterized protein (DUF2336 family)
MSTAQQFMDGIEAALKGRSSLELGLALRCITNLLVLGVRDRCDAEIERFDYVLCRLAGHLDRETLAQLSSAIATVEKAPTQLARRFARHDDITVAEPVLQGARCLAIDDLMEIASTGGQTHLAAIADRPVVEEVLADLLVKRGNTAVAEKLAGNPEVRLSTFALATLLRRAETEPGLAEVVVQRSDVSADRLAQLLTRATEVVRDRLLALTEPKTRAKIETALLDIPAELDHRSSSRRDYSAAQSLVSSLQHDPSVMCIALMNAARQGDYEMSVTLLSALSGLALDGVERIMSSGDTAGLLLLCRGSGLEWHVVRAVLRLDPVGAGRMEARLHDFGDQFEKIDAATARGIVRFWQVRTKVADYLRLLPSPQDAGVLPERRDDERNAQKA